MALQGPFFGKRDNDPAASRTPGSPLGGTSSLASAGGSAQPFAAPVSAPAAMLAAPAESGAKLTVGPNIKLKGVEITDCDTLVVEGTVEAAMNSRVIQIAEQGAFKGSAEIDIAEVRGIFDGNLTVRQKLVIFATGKVIGKIRYGKIVIEEGGQLSGEITFGISQDSSPAAGSGAVTNGSGKPSVKGEQLAVAA
ncbi:polymer-forming cytoskeletal protein [Ottowia sp.]|uniref:bactofilin family protein n=1 Tax=Ottowia sp. TaxID=1898956 RepID=UPI0025F58324|nr:polymer-forming cytoskeletal protein [Ottowia sp.]MBK6614777.1 polymer-forming cytoskeletal protein [Ottowia sp.]MBK6745861.1 polymer-forming cytoskeletal protein [Ottowia sp.]